MSGVHRSSAKRHRQDNEDVQPERCKKKTGRRRIPLACEECRSRKRKCDGAMPACSGCAKRMSVCIYTSEVEARVWHNSMVQVLRNRLEALEGPNPEIQESGYTADVMALPESPEAERASGPRMNYYQNSVTNTDDNHPETHPDQTQNGRRSLSQSSQEQVPSPEQEPGLKFSQPHSFEKLMRPVHRVMGRKGGPVEMAMNNPLSPPTPSSMPETRCTCDLAFSETQWHLPPRRLADNLVATYFSKANNMYPIIHQPSFRRLYDRLWEPDEVSDSRRDRCSGLCKRANRGRVFAAMLHTIFALATLLEPGPPKQNAIRADTFFDQAQGLNFIDVLENEIEIDLVLLGLLMGYYLQGTERFSKCWNITTMTIRMAQNIGLHLSPDEVKRRGFLTPATNTTQLECEMQSRIWYGCIVLEREVSMCFGRQLMVLPVGQTLRLPDLIDDARLSSTAGEWNTQPAGLPSMLESYVQTIKLYEILSRVLEREESRDLSSAKACGNEHSDWTSTIQNILGLDAAIMEWRNSLPRYLYYKPLEEYSPGDLVYGGLPVPEDILRAQAKRLYIRFLHVRILLLRPSLEILLEKQQIESYILKRNMVDSKLEDLLLPSMVTQCILCTQALVDILDTEISIESCQAWWYNVSYLHSSASTILISQLCKFDDGNISRESLMSSLDRCLHCLSNYAEVSSIAKKSTTLLEQINKRLQYTQHPSDIQSECNGLERDCQGSLALNPTDILERQTAQGAENLNTTELEATILPGFEDEFWSFNAGTTSCWPSIAFPSQLENFLPSIDETQGIE